MEGKCDQLIGRTSPEKRETETEKPLEPTNGFWMNFMMEGPLKPSPAQNSQL
jgi:hypothetical protein